MKYWALLTTTKPIGLLQRLLLPFGSKNVAWNSFCSKTWRHLWLRDFSRRCFSTFLTLARIPAPFVSHQKTIKHCSKSGASQCATFFEGHMFCTSTCQSRADTTPKNHPNEFTEPRFDTERPWCEKLLWQHCKNLQQILETFGFSCDASTQKNKVSSMTSRRHRTIPPLLPPSPEKQHNSSPFISVISILNFF